MSQSHSTDGFLQSVRVQGATLKNSFRFRGALNTEVPKRIHSKTLPSCYLILEILGLFERFDLAHSISQSIGYVIISSFLRTNPIKKI